MKTTRGFTLIELLVAVLVIGIITALVFPKMSGVKQQTYTNSMRNTLNKAISAQENLMSRDGSFGSFSMMQEVGFSPDRDVELRVQVRGYGNQQTVLLTATHRKTLEMCTMTWPGPPPTCQIPAESPFQEERP